MTTDPSIQPELLEDESFPTDQMSFLQGGMQLTPEQQAELDADPELAGIQKAFAEEILADAISGEEKNPYSDCDPPELIKTYLDNSNRGVRWLAEKANVSRKKVYAFVNEISLDISEDEFVRMVSVIKADYAEWVRRKEAKAARVAAESGGTDTVVGGVDFEHPVITKTPVKAVEPPSGLNRQARRKWMADFKAGKIKEPVKSRGRTPGIIRFDEFGNPE